MLRIEIYHKAESLPTFRKIQERLQQQHYRNGVQIKRHPVEESNPYLGKKEVQIYIEAERLNGMPHQEGLILLTDPESQQANTLYLDGLFIKEVLITRPTLTEDVVRLVTSFDES